MEWLRKLSMNRRRSHEAPAGAGGGRRPGRKKEEVSHERHEGPADRSQAPRVIALLIVFVQHVVQSMTNNPWFASMAALVATTGTDLAALITAQAKALTKAKGAAEARNDAKKVVIDDLKLLKSGVQTVVNQNPGQAATIIESAGFFQKKVTLPSKPYLEALMAPVTPGEVLVRARAVKRAGYEWQYSLDGGKTWLTMGNTTVANTSL